MTGRARSFGSVAAAYEAFRPGYPDELVDAVLDYAGRPLRTALEIGAGTGKATRVFARRGIVVTATDPDEAMLAELRRHVPDTVLTRCAALEDLEPGPRFDLVLAAASLHWTEPEGRWSRVAAVLAPGGVFASFGGPLALADDSLEAAVAGAGRPFLGDAGVTWPDGTPTGGRPAAEAPAAGTPVAEAMQWPGTELVASEWLHDVRQSTLERRRTMAGRDYVRHLGTISAYLALPAATRREAFARILEVLPERVEVSADVILHLARLR